MQRIKSFHEGETNLKFKACVNEFGIKHVEIILVRLKIFKCKICHRNFPSKNGLNYHLKYVHTHCETV